MVWILQNVIEWRNGQVNWVLGGIGGSDGSVWVMGEWSVDSGCHKLSENI